MNRILVTAAFIVASWLTCASSMAQAPGYRVRESLYLPPAMASEAQHPIEEMLASGTFASPAEGDQVVCGDGSTVTWRRMDIEEPAFMFDVDPGSWMFCSIDGLEAGSGLITISGHDGFHLNGLARPSMPAKVGQMKYPIELKQGSNELLVKVSKGPVMIRIQASDHLESDVHILQYDRTIPWLLDRHHVNEFISLLVLNSGNERLKDLRVATKTQFVPMPQWADYPDDAVPGVWEYTSLASLPANSIAKVPMQVIGPPPHKRSGLPYVVDVEIQQESEEGFQTLAATTVNLSSRNKGNAFKRTWVDELGTVQQCIIMAPESEFSPDGEPLPTIVSFPSDLTGYVQTAYAYEEGREALLVVPSTRRASISDSSLGHDHVLEALSLADALHGIDHDQIMASGFADAGISSVALAEARPGLLSGVACIGSDVPLRDESRSFRNLDTVDLLVRHGEFDETISPDMADSIELERDSILSRTRVEIVPEMERWWGAKTIADELIDSYFFEKDADVDRMRSIQVLQTSSTRAHGSHWAVIHQREDYREPAMLQAKMLDNSAQINTSNVRQLLIRGEAIQSSGPLDIEIDGTDLRIDSDFDEICLQRESGAWKLSDGCDVLGKSRHRSCHEDLFRRPLLLVHGTQGSDVQNRNAWGKARFDAEQFWYVADGAASVVADTDLTDEMLDGVNVVLYGNSETNAVWDRFMIDSPIDVTSSQVVIGDETIKGEDLAAVFIRPMRGDPKGLVVAVANTGDQSAAVLNPVLVTQPGQHHPDWMLFNRAEASEPVRSGSFQRNWAVAR